MRTVFEILPTDFDAEICTLYCELSNEGFSFCVRDDEKNTFIAIAIYHYDKTKPSVGFPIALQIIFHQKEILSKTFQKVYVTYSYPESVLVPAKLYDKVQVKSLLNMMCGDLCGDEIVFTEEINGGSLYNCYRVPRGSFDVLKEHFPNAVAIHQYSLLMKEATGESRMSVIFNAQKIVVTVTKGEVFQLVNSYDYETPQDVCYTLLNICEQLQAQDVALQLAGLVEEKSALYTEIFKYFKNVSFAPLPPAYSFSEDILKYPQHYFTYLFAISKCEL